MGPSSVRIPDIPATRKQREGNEKVVWDALNHRYASKTHASQMQVIEGNNYLRCYDGKFPKLNCNPLLF